MDKFAFKNPRKDERLKGGSIMQSLRTRKSVKPLNNPDFFDRPESEIDEEHVCILKKILFNIEN